MSRSPRKLTRRKKTILHNLVAAGWSTQSFLDATDDDIDHLMQEGLIVKYVSGVRKSFQPEYGITQKGRLIWNSGV